MMKLLGILFAAAVFVLANASPSSAQIFVVQTCGTVPASMKTLTAGNPGMFFEDTTGTLCSSTGGGGGGGGTSAVDEAAFVAGTTAFAPGGGFFQTTATSNPLTNGQGGWWQMTAFRAGMVNLRNASGVEIGTSTTPIVNNLAQVGGSALALGPATGSASVPVVLANNQTAADPCMFAKKTNLAISQNGTSSVQLVALSGSTTIYVCSLSLVAAGATTVALTTGTGTACATSNAAVIGTTTASIANSLSFAANGGMTLGNGGNTIANGAASSELCMILGTSVFVSGNLTYVQL